MSLNSSVLFFPFIAPPNGGKGTQTAKLSLHFDLPRIDMGSLLRAIAKEDSPLGHKVGTTLANGQLVSLEIVIDVLRDGIEKELAKRPPVEGEKAGFILDGFPRSLEQTESLLALCEQSGAQVAQAIYLDVPDKVIVERAANRRICQACGEIHSLTNKPLNADGTCTNCGSSDVIHRIDDHPEKVQKRLISFRDDTLPILSVFETRQLLTKISADRTVETIFDDLVALMHPHLNGAPATV